VRLDLPLGRRVTRREMVLPVEVVHGKQPGPRLFVCAAVHGDEINGVEIIRRLLRRPLLQRMRGALIAVPIVNVFGFVGLSRYLPDRRDLNRSFPGSSKGSLAGRIAHIFLTEIVENATHGIDLHTGAVHRSNLPQVRAWLDDEETARLAHAFKVPVIVNANVRDGSLRQEVLERKVPMLVYEGGEALRFNEPAIRAGVGGVLSVMQALGMLPASTPPRSSRQPFISHTRYWVRAPEAGILRTRIRLGAPVDQGQRLATVVDPLGMEEVGVFASRAGIVIGRTELPLVNEGDALFHIAVFESPLAVADSLERFHEDLDDPTFPSDRREEPPDQS
jgi:predicted deacylase